MKPRVHHFLKSEAKILKTVSFTSNHYGHIAGISHIVQDFIGGIKSQKPPKPRHHLHQEYPCELNGTGENFAKAQDTDNDNLGIVRMIQVAQDENDSFYLRFETNQGFYYVSIH